MRLTSSKPVSGFALGFALGSALGSAVFPLCWTSVPSDLRFDIARPPTIAFLLMLLVSVCSPCQPPSASLISVPEELSNRAGSSNDTVNKKPQENLDFCDNQAA